MSEQLSLFGASIKDVQRYLSSSLSNVLARNGLAGLPISFAPLKSLSNKYSIKLDDSVIAYIFNGKVKTYLELPTPNTISSDNKNTYKIYLDSLSDVTSHVEEIELSLQTILDRLPKDFSCCSRYEECSNQGICTHPDKRTALGCFYRKQLSHGKIFYGKNRNIE